MAAASPPTLQRELLANPAGDGFGVLRNGGDCGGGGAGWIEGGEDSAGFPDVSAGAVRSDLAWVAPRMDGEKFVRHGGGQVHGSAVDADDECGLAQQPEEFGEAGFIEEVGNVGREAGDFFVAASDEHDRMIHGMAERNDGLR